MTNQFDNKDGGDQNIAQGDGAMGKQEVTSGDGNVTVNQGLRVKLRTVVLAVVLLAGIGGGAYYLLARYSEALLDSISKEIGDRAGQGVTLTNISHIYDAWGDYDTALKHLEQSLAMQREIGDRVGEGVTLNNISWIYHDRGDYDSALKYLEQSLAIQRDLGKRHGEGAVLNNIGNIYRIWGDYATALKYLEQSLVIQREIGDRVGQAGTIWNIGLMCENQGNLAKAEQYMSRAVEIEEKIGHPDLESDRKALEELRAAIKKQERLL